MVGEGVLLLLARPPLCLGPPAFSVAMSSTFWVGAVTSQLAPFIADMLILPALATLVARKGIQVIIPSRGCETMWRHLRPMGDLGQIHFLVRPLLNTRCVNVLGFLIRLFILRQEYQLLDEASIADTVKHSDVVINLVGKSVNTR